MRSLAESGNIEGKRGAYRLVRPIDQTGVPPTVTTILAARIDRLAEREKRLLQTAAVIGREFSEPVLARAAALGEDELEPALRALIVAEFLYEQELYPEAVYAFKHPLTQEVAYQSQLGERRAGVHRRVAEALQELYADKLDERSALLAQHWEAAGDALAAAQWSARAAGWVGLNDIGEALRHWRKVSELVEALPDSPESSALALGARVARLHYGWRLGISEQEATAHYEAGRALAERSGDAVNLLLITAAYASVRGLAGHVEEYGELGAEVNRLGIEIGDPSLRIATMPASVYARFVRGHLAESLAIVDEAIALGAEDPTLGRGLVLTCPYAWHLMFRGALLVGMGYPEEAVPMLERALEAAAEHGDHETESWTHGNYVLLARSTGQQELALGHATQAYEIAERIGDAFSRIFALYSLGCARLMAGEASKAVTLLGPYALKLAVDRMSAHAAFAIVAGMVLAYAGARFGAGFQQGGNRGQERHLVPRRCREGSPPALSPRRHGAAAEVVRRRGHVA